MRIWADSLCPDEEGRIFVTIPAQPQSRDLDHLSQNILLVLRAIAQSEVISQADIADNLRLPTGAVSSAMHYSMSRGWIEETVAGYRLSWEWFRTITTVLARQNLLAR
jgi:DNA-binding IclR family transcriptional regulator